MTMRGVKSYFYSFFYTVYHALKLFVGLIATAACGLVGADIVFPGFRAALLAQVPGSEMLPYYVEILTFLFLFLFAVSIYASLISGVFHKGLDNGYIDDPDAEKAIKTQRSLLAQQAEIIAQMAARMDMLERRPTGELPSSATRVPLSAEEVESLTVRTDIILPGVETHEERADDLIPLPDISPAPAEEKPPKEKRKWFARKPKAEKPKVIEDLSMKKPSWGERLDKWAKMK